MGPKKKGKGGGKKGKKGGLLADEDDMKSFNFHQREILEKMMNRYKELNEENQTLKQGRRQYMETFLDQAEDNVNRFELIIVDGGCKVVPKDRKSQRHEDHETDARNRYHECLDSPTRGPEESCAGREQRHF